MPTTMEESEARTLRIEQSVRMGTQELDQFVSQFPGDRRVKVWGKAGGWRQVVNVAMQEDMFDIYSSNRCILGILFGDYLLGMFYLFPQGWSMKAQNGGSDYGFAVREIGDRPLLEVAWVFSIRSDLGVLHGEQQ